MRRDPNRRIVCLTDEPTDILYRLGESERVVGISAYTTRPEEAVRDKPRVTGFRSGSVRKIAALEPDLVIGFSEIQSKLAEALIAEGLQVFIFNQRTFDGILDAIVTIARLVGAEERGQALAGRCVDVIQATRDRAERRGTAPSVYFEEWYDPIITGIAWVSELIETAGGRDVFAELRSRPMARDRVVTPEDILERAPEVVLASWCGKPFDRDGFESRPGFSALPAVREGRVHELDGSVFLQPGPTCILDGLPQLEALFFDGGDQSGSKPSGASSNPANSNAGETVQPTSE